MNVNKQKGAVDGGPKADYTLTEGAKVELTSQKPFPLRLFGMAFTVDSRTSLVITDF